MDLFSIREIHGLLARHGFRFSKSLGQNFLTERAVCEKIVEMSEISEDDCILEIGPGIGSLTSVLALHAKKVISVEIDRALIPVLAETLSDFSNTKVINSDIMKCNIKELIDTEFCGQRPKVCANLPYYITTPILSLLIKSGAFSTITTMVQKEVAERICASPGTPEYGAFTVLMQYYTDPELLFTVPAECFEPKPKVQSAVVIMRTLDVPRVTPKSEEMFFKVVRASFAQRRKQLVNGLYSAFDGVLLKEEVSDILVSLGHEPNVRGEHLSIEQFCKISDAIYKKTKGALK